MFQIPKVLQLVRRWNQVNEVVYSQFVYSDFLVQLVCHFYLVSWRWLSLNCSSSSSSSSNCSSDLEFHWPIFHLVSVALWQSLNVALIDLYQRWLGQNQQSVCLGVNPHLRLALLDTRPIDREITNENVGKWIDECVISNTFIYFSFSFSFSFRLFPSRFIASEVCLLLHCVTRSSYMYVYVYTAQVCISIVFKFY